MEIRVYKDGSKTGKTGKLIIAGFLIALIMVVSGYALFKWKLPFLEVQTFTIIAVFITGLSTFGKFKGLPLWQFFYLALKFRLTINQRSYVVERKEDVSKNKKENKKSERYIITRKGKKTKAQDK